MAPILGKRPSPDQDDSTREPASKRQRIEPTPPLTPPPEEHFEAKVTDAVLFNDEPRQLLLRSVALALEHVGFSGASPEAMEALCAEVDEYAAEFLSGVTQSMLNARRSQPTPLDFKYALYRFDLPVLSLQPHSKPPIPASRYIPTFEYPAPAEEPDTDLQKKLLGEDLSGEQDKNSRAYIPKKFPSFPSKHTYKWTVTAPARPNPRDIREEAAKTARLGEEALRRLVKVSKAGKEKDVKKAASKDPRSKERHDMWEKTMQNLMAGNRPTTNGNLTTEEDRSMIVNSEQQYFRKAVVKKRNIPDSVAS
ncbi:hypothetical protein BP5796_11014 [Coleophoma crateriformis]|uniref:Transcription initiation factor TFIID subunit 8 n=1 Tax=Coleophoma crateriformis TaxID=565419 RepID=A0A3D8QLN4_9HELO|nr:hypothetical protein BP5796_11014 [Coleophoma crateriformis]